MGTILKMAWRNLWRNRRRTLITSASVFFGVVFSTLMTSMQEGSYEYYIRSITEFYSGHLQVQDTAWWEDRSVNHTFVPSLTLMREIPEKKGVRGLSLRIESFALASAGNTTRGVAVMGVLPSMEDSLTHLSRKIVSGRYLTEADSGVYLASGLADFLKLQSGDTLALISQGYHGSSAAGLFPIRGIFKHPTPALNNQLLVMSLPACQQFFSLHGRVSSLVVMLHNNRGIDELRTQAAALAGDSLRVMDWAEMQPELVQQVESDRASNGLMKLLLYIIIGFGILGTIIMMMKERSREMGVMVASGMQKYRLGMLLIVETIFLSALGVVAGLAGSLPLVFYFYHHPIPFTGQAAEAMLAYGWEPVLMFSVHYQVFLQQALTIFVLALLVAVYPLLHIRKMNVAERLKS